MFEALSVGRSVLISLYNPIIRVVLCVSGRAEEEVFTLN